MSQFKAIACSWIWEPRNCKSFKHKLTLKAMMCRDCNNEKIWCKNISTIIENKIWFILDHNIKFYSLNVNEAASYLDLRMFFTVCVQSHDFHCAVSYTCVIMLYLFKCLPHSSPSCIYSVSIFDDNFLLPESPLLSCHMYSISFFVSPLSILY